MHRRRLKASQAHLESQAPSDQHRRSGLDTHLILFIDALRSTGVNVSVSGSIAAAQALSLISLDDREELREALATTLISNHIHRSGFDILFDIWFSNPRSRTPITLSDNVVQARDKIVEILQHGDEAVESSAEVALDQFGEVNTNRRQSFSAYQTLRQLDMQSLVDAIAAGLNGDDRNDIAAERVNRFEKAVREAARDRFTQIHGPEYATTHLAPDVIEDASLQGPTPEQIEQMRVIVTPLARMIGSKIAVRRRRAHRGAIDVRRTLRESISTGGVPINLAHRRRKPRKPELVFLCDLSESVARFSLFTLTLIKALAEEFPSTKVFGFIDHVDDITDYLHDDMTIESIYRIVADSKVAMVGGSSYGSALRAFDTNFPGVITTSTTLFILGDARSNYADPADAIIAKLCDTAKNAYWLNPEKRDSWGRGDSATDIYRKHVEMFECSTIRQLTSVIAEIMPT